MQLLLHSSVIICIVQSKGYFVGLLHALPLGKILLGASNTKSELNKMSKKPHVELKNKQKTREFKETRMKSNFLSGRAVYLKYAKNNFAAQVTLSIRM